MAPMGLNDAPQESVWYQNIRRNADWGAEDIQFAGSGELRKSLLGAAPEDLTECLSTIHALSSSRFGHCSPRHAAIEIWDALASVASKTKNAKISRWGVDSKVEPVTPPPPLKKKVKVEDIEDLPSGSAGSSNSSLLRTSESSWRTNAASVATLEDTSRKRARGYDGGRDTVSGTFPRAKDRTSYWLQCPGGLGLVLEETIEGRYEVLLPTEEDIANDETKIVADNVRETLHCVALQASSANKPVLFALDCFKELSADTKAALHCTWQGFYSLVLKHLSTFAENPEAYASPTIPYLRRETQALIDALRPTIRDRLRLRSIIVAALSREFFLFVKSITPPPGEWPSKVEPVVSGLFESSIERQAPVREHHQEPGGLPLRKRYKLTRNK